MGAPLSNKPMERRLRELDGWRAVSVLLVIVYHFCVWQHPEVFSPHVRLFRILQYCGPLGVKVFFVISGFVICRFLILEEKRFGAVSLKAFYIRRALRILPPFYLYLAVVALLSSLGLLVNPWTGMLSSTFFLHDLTLNKAHDWFIGHTWSLAVEEQYYLIFPALWVVSRRTSRVRLFLLLFSLIVVWNVSEATLPWNHLTAPAARLGFACICCGVIVAILEPQARTLARAVPMLVVIALMLILLWDPVQGLTWSAALYESVFVPPAIAILLMFSLERRGWLQSLLRWSPLRAIGVTFYATYLWQQLFTARPYDLSVTAKPLCFMLPLLLVIVPLSWYFIEKPAMRLGRRLSERFRVQSPPKSLLTSPLCPMAESLKAVDSF